MKKIHKFIIGGIVLFVLIESSKSESQIFDVSVLFQSIIGGSICGLLAYVLFGRAKNKDNSADFDVDKLKTGATNTSIDSPEDFMNALINIREGIALYLKKEHGFKDEAIGDVFRNLIAEEEIPKRSKDESGKIIEAIKNNRDALDMFLLGMRVKTMMMSKVGMLTEGVSLRAHLLELGMNITDSSSGEILSSEEFAEQTSNFYKEYKMKYA